MSLIEIKPLSKVNEIPEKSIIGFDTSLVWSLWGDPEMQRKPAERNELETFVAATAKRDIAIVLPMKVHEELNILVTTVELGGKDGRKQKLQHDRSLMNRPMDIVDQILSTLDELPNFYNEPVGSMDYDTLIEVRRTIRLFGLELGDSAIYTQLRNAGVPRLATLDGDFHNINDDTNGQIWVPSWKYRAIMRDRESTKDKPGSK